MLSIYNPFLLLSTLLATTVVAGPVAVRSPDISPAPVERGVGITLGSYSLATSHVKDVLFNVGVGSTDGSVSESLHLEVECVDCRTWGTAVVTTGGVQKDDSLIGEIEAFFENPIDAIISAFDLDVKISFENVGGHFDFDIVASDTVSYSFPIFASSSPSGVAVSEEVTFGFVLFVDLTFSLTAEIDLEAGFEFAFPDGAYITVDPLGGNIVDHGFTGGSVSHLPIIVTSGSATFKAALRVRVQAGTTVELFGTGFDFELGVYADLIEYEATLATTPECELSVTESLDVNIGAFAHAVLEVDYSTVGASPAVVTTVLDVPLPSLCITRATDSDVLALPTGVAASAVPVTLPGAGAALLSISALSVPVFTLPPSATAPSPSNGGIFIPVPTFSLSSSYASTTGSAGSPYAASNSTLGAYPSQITSYPSKVASSGSYTSAASPFSSKAAASSSDLTTSTIYTTTLLTLTHCASTILNCPASLASEIIITSTSVLYTTICPVGQAQPTSLPQFKPTYTLKPTPISSSVTNASAAAVYSTVLISPIPLTPCPTPIVSTIYTPTYITPTYTRPASLPASTATSYPLSHAPDPSAISNGNSTVSTYNAAVVTPSVTAALAGVGKAAATVVAGTVTPYPVSTGTGMGAVGFTGSAGRGVEVSFAVIFAGWVVGALI